MLDKHYIGLDLTSFEDNGKLRPISRVTLFLDSDNYVTAGDDTGYELKADCPHGTQAMADALLEKYKGFEYKQYQAGSARLDPLAELGDGVTVGGVYSMIAETGKAGDRFQNVSAPGDEELEDEYPSEGGPMTQQLERQLAQNRSEIAKTAESITLTVEEVKETAESASEKVTKLEQTVDGLTLEASSFVSEDLFAGQEWRNGTTVTNDGSSETVGTTIEVPTEKLSSLPGSSITFSIEVKALSDIPNTSCYVALWTVYGEENNSSYLVINDDIAKAEDWTKCTATVHLENKAPTRIYLYAYVLRNCTASFSVRNATAYIRDTQSSTLTLKAGETTLSSTNITLAGVVTFQNLETAGETIINGSNIKTGVVQNYEGTTIYDLENGTIQMGSNAGPHVKITDNMIRWYLAGGSTADEGATGIFYSVFGSTWIGANSTNTYYGWMPAGTPTNSGNDDGNRNGYVGLRISHTNFGGDVAHFNTKSVECGDNFGNGQGYFEAYSAKINGSWIGPQAASLMVVNTKQYGDIVLTGTDSASPIAFDSGSGVLDETGKCYLYLTDEFASTVSTNVTPQWHITPTSESEKPLTVQKDGLYAIVTGDPGTTFDWLCIMPQKGCETLYCEPLDFDMSDGMDRKDYTADAELDSVENFERNLNDEVLTVLKENNYIEEIWPEQLERRA